MRPLESGVAAVRRSLDQALATQFGERAESRDGELFQRDVQRGEVIANGPDELKLVLDGVARLAEELVEKLRPPAG